MQESTGINGTWNQMRAMPVWARVTAGSEVVPWFRKNGTNNKKEAFL